jgi:hypothetical protein
MLDVVLVDGRESSTLTELIVVAGNLKIIANQHLVSILSVSRGGRNLKWKLH